MVRGDQSTWGKATQARGEHANSTQKGPGGPGPSTVLTTKPPCCPLQLQHYTDFADSFIIIQIFVYLT